MDRNWDGKLGKEQARGKDGSGYGGGGVDDGGCNGCGEGGLRDGGCQHEYRNRNK